jgi:hypothetical protein
MKVALNIRIVDPMDADRVQGESARTNECIVCGRDTQTDRPHGWTCGGCDPVKVVTVGVIR